MSTLRIPRTKIATDAAVEEVIADLASQLQESMFSYGTSAPTATTPGQLYFKLGAAASNALTIYIKVLGTWYGG